MAFQKIGIIGAGAWGTALAVSARRAGRDVVIWARESESVANINAHHCNRLFLPDIDLDPQIRATDDLAEIAACDAILMVPPAQFVRASALEFAPHFKDGTPVVICAKGIEQKTGALLSTVLEESLPGALPAILSGPSFAFEVARNLPTAVTLASSDEALGQELVDTLGHQTFRPYWSSDMLGVQIGGAVKNVLAIAAGIVDGLELGANAHAALITRGFRELVRFGVAHGAHIQTLSGLSGLGDLMLTSSSQLSRNMSLGQALGRGQNLEQIMGARNSVSEGVFTASAVMGIAQQKQIDMPICQSVQEVLSGTLTIEHAVKALLSRPFRAEDK